MVMCLRGEGEQSLQPICAHSLSHARSFTMHYGYLAQAPELGGALGIEGICEVDHVGSPVLCARWSWVLAPAIVTSALKQTPQKPPRQCVVESRQAVSGW